MKTPTPYSRSSLLETALGLGCILAASLQSAHAASIYWDGLSAGWDVATNWSTVASADNPDPAAVPTVGDDAIFNIDTVDGAAVVSLNAARSVNSLTFNNTGTTLLQGGGVANQILTIGAGGITVDAAAGAVTIGSATALQNVSIVLGASQTWTNNSAATVSIVSPFTSGAGIGLIKAGSGTVAMTSTANTTNIGGTLDVQAGKFQVAGDITTAGLIGSGTFENGGAAAKWMFVNNAADNVFSGNIQGGAGVARLGFIKRGVGTTTWGGTNVLGDRLAVENGTIKVTGSTTGGFAAGGANNVVTIGTIGAQNGRMLVEGGTLIGARTASPSISVSGANNAQGFLKMTSGSISSANQFHVGTGKTTSFAAYTQTGGTLTSGNWLVVGLNNDRAVFNQSGGAVNLNADRMTIGAGGNASIGVVNLSGGTFTSAAGGNTGIFVGENGTGILNVSGTAALTLATNGTATSGTLQFGGNAVSLAGSVNLLGGTTSVFGVTKGASTAGAVYQLNFNGGTLKAAVANPNFLANLANTEAYVHSGGGTVDNNGANISIAEPLLAPTGNGVSSSGITATGGGYLDTPLVTVTGGGGTGATAVATIDAAGNLTGITMTNPGVNYTSAPAFALSGGGFGNTGALTGAATLVPNTSGGMTFTGAGTTTLTGANTFSGPIAVNGGKLAFGGNYGSNAVTVAATQGITVADPAGAIGTLTVSALTLGNGATIDLESNGTTGDKIVITTAGGLSLGTLGFNLYDTGTTNPALAGTYTLLEYNTSFTGGTAGLSVLNPRPGYIYNFTDTGSAITVNAVAVDTDGDGMTDVYEVANGLDPNDATGVNGAAGNLDGDFATNYEEFIAGTGANNASSDPLNTDNDGLLDSWEVTYFGGIAAQTGAGDYDGDFDTNLQEFTNTTNPALAGSLTDSDSDGLGDGWEILYFTNIGAKDGTADSDADLVTDLQEYEYGSNPTDSSFSPVFAKAKNRWSFTNNLVDSVGTSNATIENLAGTNVVTQNPTSITFAGGAKATSQWVKLGSNLLPSRNTPCTIQLWATYSGVQNWSRVFDFHNSTAETLFMSWSVAGTNGTDRVGWVDAANLTSDNTNGYLSGTTKYHIVMTIEPSPTIPGSSLVKWYSAPEYDGVGNLAIGAPKGVATVANSLALMNDAINAIGYSVFPDNTANATYDEVRLWDGALPQWAIQGLHEQGPDNPAQTDSDTDGLPDAFEEFYFGDGVLVHGPASNPDGDSATNLEELLGGSDPNNALSDPNDTDLDGLPDAWELSNFGDLDETAGGDPDGDFALNSDEFAAATDPALYTSFPDTDSDGMSDAWETFYVGDLSDSGTGDTDGDGFNTLAEFVAKSLPNDPLSPGVADGDADNDSLPDRWEVAWFGATTLATANGSGDADGDSATNLQEYQATSDPLAAISTPADINGDGTADQHVFHGMTAAGTGPQDKDGEATPFTVRLAASGTAIPTVDPNLDLDTTAGTLAMTTSSSDINGQVNMAQLEALGIPLSSLGFTGNQDFRIRAHFVNLPVLAGYDQIGAYVGTSTTSMTRAGAIGATYQALGVNTAAVNDSDPTFGAAGAAGKTGGDLTVIIERIGGVWSMSCNDTASNPGVQPAFLDGNAALEGGVFVLDQNVHKTAILESFTAVSFGASSPDADSDGMDDAWETAQLGNTSRDGTLDFDGDGVIDLLEFAFNGDPDSGSSRGTITSALLDTNANLQKELTLTIAVRTGATFAAGPNGSQVATVNGVTYTVRGSLDLATFTSAVSHVSSTASGDPDYDLHTFRLDVSEGLGGKGFLQAVATHP